MTNRSPAPLRALVRTCAGGILLTGTLALSTSSAFAVGPDLAGPDVQPAAVAQPAAAVQIPTISQSAAPAAPVVSAPADITAAFPTVETADGTAAADVPEGFRADESTVSYSELDTDAVPDQVLEEQAAAEQADEDASVASGTTPTAPELSDAAGSSILDTARSGIGVKYVWAGETTNGWDCSGFTQWAYARHGIALPHSSSAQKAMGTTISQSEARPGDLVHWPGHVGIYAGNGKVVDAGRTGMVTSERAIWGNPTFVRIDGAN